MDKKETLPKWQLYLIMLAFLVFGSFNTLVLKNMDLVEVGYDEDLQKPKRFRHPYFQCANMMLGMFMCLFYYLGYLAYRNCKKTPEPDLTASEISHH
jgi:hypothetical protein